MTGCYLFLNAIVKQPEGKRFDDGATFPGFTAINKRIEEKKAGNLLSGNVMESGTTINRGNENLFDDA